MNKKIRGGALLELYSEPIEERDQTSPERWRYFVRLMRGAGWAKVNRRLHDLHVS